MKGKRLAAFVLCVAIAGGAAGYIGYAIGSERRGAALNEQLQQMAVPSEPSHTVAPAVTEPAADEPAVTEALTETEAQTETELPTEPKTPFVSPIDFVSLQRMNSDIYGWIEIPGTDISYPILQHNLEPDYYLMHRADGTHGWPGAIYTQCIASKDFSDFCTVIYGHNMSNGSMFAPLKGYRDESFFQEHRDIVIYTPYATYSFTVFAAVIYNNYLINYLFDFDQEDQRTAFLQSLDETRNLNNHISDDIPVGPEDHVIVLSTCTGGGHDHRYLVLAVLTNVED